MGNSANTLLIIGFVWPEPSTTAAGNRMLQLIHFFKEQKYKITFASTASKSDYSFDLSSLGVQSQAIELNNSSFNDFAAALNPELVLFDRFLTEEQFGWRVAETVPNAIHILDTEDLHSLRTVRERCLKTQEEFTNDRWLQDDETKREMASIFRCDLSLIISTYEMQLLSEVVKIDESLLLYLPFQIDKITAEDQHSWTSFSERKHFICVGNGKHAPNVDAIKWLKTEIWPLIRKELPTADLHIYGAYLPEQLQQLHKPAEGFLVKGWAKDVAEVMEQSCVNLAPLRFGAGIKGKLIDAMQLGTPSVTTKIGAEGMHGDLLWNGSIENTAESFAKAAIDLYQDQEQWMIAQRNGIEIINKLYDKKLLEEALRNEISKIRDNLQHHRNQNFMGSLLMHQTLASTKYMSKWIEAKNNSSPN